MRITGRSGLVLLLALALLAPSAALATPASELRSELGPGTTVDADAETGRQVTFIGTDPGATIPLEASRPRAAATEAIDRFAPAFGLGRGAEIEIADVSAIEHGATVVRTRQLIAGVPVIGGELVINLDAAGDLRSIGGELEPETKVATDPAVSAAEADDAALAAIAKYYDVSAGDLAADAGELSIYDSRILGGPGLEIPMLVWRFEVTSSDAATPIRELVLVDAASGNVVLNINQLEEAKVRRVCDDENTFGEAGNDADGDLPCEPIGWARVEGNPPVASVEVNRGYDISGGVYDFYMSRFARDSIDGAGLPLITTVRYCGAQFDPFGNLICPFPNAFWDGSQMTYGDGAMVDDIAGHELTHGVTEFDSDLFYYYQSGAINESLSDVFGELFDRSYGAEPAAHAWFIGEGSSLGAPGGTAPGAFRNMANPPQFFDPDRMGHPFYWEREGDRGGVHINSGVNNKAAYLLTDGGSFRGQSVRGLGDSKAGWLYYIVNRDLLGSAADYQDLANAMRQACSTLAGSGGAGFVPADCGEVEDAIVATEMDWEATEAPTLQADVCPQGQSPVDSFFDDMESGVAANWPHSALSGAVDRWFYPSVLSYAKSGTRMLRGEDWHATGDYAIRMDPPGPPEFVTVPAGGRLHFDHAFGFESSNTTGVHFDGGVVEYSTAAAPAVWLDARNLFTAGGYTGTLGSGSALGGQPAFVGDSRGYGSSRLDLGSLAGQQVRFRFRIATDAVEGDVGWFIDNVRIYRCGGGADGTAPNTRIVEGEPEPTSDETPDFSFESSESGSSFQCKVDGGEFAACSSPHETAPLSNGAHDFYVRAVDPAGNTDPTPARWTLTVDGPLPDTHVIFGPRSAVRDPYASFEFAASRSDATFQCRIDGSPFAACGRTHTTGFLGDGAHLLEVRAVDPGGDVDPTPAAFEFSVIACEVAADDVRRLRAKLRRAKQKLRDARAKGDDDRIDRAKRKVQRVKRRLRDTRRHKREICG